jgi:hypothetical protein
MLEETGVVRAYGGEVVMVDYVPEHSTTAVVRRIREATAAAAAAAGTAPATDTADSTAPAVEPDPAP